MSYPTIDCCPAPTALLPYLTRLKSETGCYYNSIYRGVDARPELEACGKHDQAWLYANLPPGVANPPGRSTHELRSDGVAYLGPLGRVLVWWQCGIDLDDAHVAGYVAQARANGWVVSVTYPGSSVEYHHVNFRMAPGGIRQQIHVWKPLKKGMGGPRVINLTRKLAFIHRPDQGQDGSTYLDKRQSSYGDDVRDAVKRFQEDHHLANDGIAGRHTIHQVRVSYRNEKHRRKVWSLKKDLDATEADLKRLRDRRDNLRELGGHEGELRQVERQIETNLKDANTLREQIRKLGADPGPRP